jgi:hypothetical protein
MIRPCMGMPSMTDRIFSTVKGDAGAAMVVMESVSFIWFV